MQPLVLTLNAFIEDTCVLFVAAYLLTRGPVLRFVFPMERASHITRRRYIFLSALLFGLLGATEFGLPNLRYPYDPTILFVAAAVFLCGLPVGAGAVGVLLVIKAVTQNPPCGPLLVALGIKFIVAFVVAALVRRAFSRRPLPTRAVSEKPWLLLVAFGAGALVQGAALGAEYFTTVEHLSFLPQRHLPILPHTPFDFCFTVIANGLGVALLQFIVRDAHVRDEVESLRRDAARHAAEVEQARAFAAEHQLAALRARVHPHFLFNTLNSIAALCVVKPEGAEKATVALGELMHRVLENNLHEPVTIEDEISDVQAYLAIERYRLGSRLQVEWHISDKVAQTRVPPFSLMTLVENAIAHGITARPGVGNLCIVARRRGPNWLCIAVHDDGAGMTVAERKNAMCLKQDRRTHGLHLMDDQLRLLFGTRARVRLFSKPGQGTLALFAVPLIKSDKEN